MYQILTLNKIANCGTDLFDKSKYAFGSEVAAPHGVLVRSAAMQDFNIKEPKLLAVARAGAGVNNIPVPACTEAGVCVFNTPGANANAVKELVIASLFIVSRNIPAAIDWAKGLKGKGSEVPALVEKGKSAFTGPEVGGKKLGVIGLGAIGVLVANAATALGMDVIGYDPYLSVSGALQLSRSVTYVRSYKEIFESCDYITLHAPATAETKGLINAEAISQMKKSVKLLNFARGELIDERAVLSALLSGGMGAYITDFPSDDLIDAPGVVALPHLGASTPESEDNCAVMAVNQLIDYLENGNIVNSVNLPSLSIPKTGDAKICVIHKNAEGTLGKLTQVLASEHLNIENMENRSKKEYAYSVFDVSGNANGSVAESLSKIDAVVRVRII